MLVVRVKEGKREEPGEATITAKGQVPVKTEKGPDVNQQALYLIVSLLDLECSRGFRHAEMVKRKGGELVLTDQADAISDDPSRIPGFVWDMHAIKEKSEQSKGIGNLWKALSAGKHTIISFKSEEDADKAYAILRAAGFEEGMLKRASKHSVKIIEVPEKLNIEGLTTRLAKNLERVKNATAAREATEVAQARKSRLNEVEKWFGKEFAVNDLARLDPKTAAEMVLYVYQQPMISGQMKESVWFLLNKRKDSAEILAEFRKLYPINTFTSQEFKDLAYSLKTEEPLPGMPKITLAQKGKVYAGDAHKELREYEAQRRGGPSEIEKAAAMPWQIPKSFRDQLANGEKVLFYTFPSAERYAEARATVEALYPGRAVSVEHTAEIYQGRDVGEWVMTVLPPGESPRDYIEASASIRSRVGPQADSPVRWVHEGKRETLSFVSITSDAVSNYSTYTTEVLINPEKQSEIPAWFKSIVIGKKAGELDAKPDIKRALLVKGVELRVEVARKIENDEGSTSYVYKITVSGENVRKPLEAARNEARSRQKAPLPEPQLKRIAAFEEPAGELTYADRMAALKDKLKKTKPES